ncbi:MAG TPA: HEPN domain-containing protein [Solirubrobacterales bacterium]|nr:HEPN domain-containing protein [Solirubrobacterales bacterium]
MDKAKIKTGESFEFEGFWWEPEASAKDAAQGMLEYTPSDGITLSVVNLHGGPEHALNGPSRLPVLHGATLQGTPCTIFDAIVRHSQGTLFGGHSKEILGSNLLLHGLHASSISELTFERARVGLRGLAEWLTEPWPGRETTFRDIAKKGLVKIPLDGARLTFQEGKTSTRDRFSKVTRRDYSALIELDEPTTLPDLNERFIRPLHDLMILGTNEEIRVTETTLLIPEELEKWWGDKKPLPHTNQVSVVQRSQLQWHRQRKNAFHQVPLPFSALGPDPVQTIRRWYSLRAELAGAGNSLFGTINRRYRTLEVDLLSLLSVAEGYHRARFDQLLVEEEEHAAAIQTMVAALPERLKENYRKRLKYTNEQTLRQRLRELIENAEKTVPRTEGWRKLVHPLVETRNFLTHWGSKSDDVLSTPDLILALSKVEIVLRINLMRDLGIDESDIEGSVNVSHGEHDVFSR